MCKDTELTISLQQAPEVIFVNNNTGMLNLYNRMSVSCKKYDLKVLSSEMDPAESRLIR